MGYRYKSLTLFSEGWLTQSQFHSISFKLYQQQMFSTWFQFHTSFIFTFYSSFK